MKYTSEDSDGDCYIASSSQVLVVRTELNCRELFQLQMWFTWIELQNSLWKPNWIILKVHRIPLGKSGVELIGTTVLEKWLGEDFLWSCWKANSLWKWGNAFGNRDLIQLRTDCSLHIGLRGKFGKKEKLGKIKIN